MRTLFLRTLSIFVCLLGLAWHPVNDRGVQPATVSNAIELVAAFSSRHAQYLPKSYAQVPVTDVQVSEKVIQANVKGVIFRVEWIGESSRYLRFNGRIFSKKELSSEQAFKKAFSAKFGVSSKKNISMMSLLFSRGLAQIDATMFGDDTESSAEDDVDLAAPESSVQDGDNTSGFVFEGEKDFNTYVLGDSVYKDDASLADTEVGRRFERVVDLTTGSNLMAMVRYVYLFQGGLAFAMNPAGGFVPGMGMMNNIGTSPSSIPFPY